MNSLTFILSICIFIIILSIFMLIRNNEVYKLRQKLLAKISNGANHDIRHNKDWRWRYIAYDLVSYNAMFNKIWLKLTPEAFWKNTSFLEINNGEKEG